MNFDLKNKFSIIIILSLLLAGCSMIKKGRIMKDGKVEQANFKTTIPFELRLGLIILKLRIHGKEYDFFLDTGAPNVLTLNLANIPGIEAVYTNKTTDSQGESSDLQFVTVDTITIGGIDFLNTAAALADLERSNLLSCLEVDGILGSNLMRQALWYFDFEKNEITICSSLDSLDLQTSYQKVDFRDVTTGTPHAHIYVDGLEEKWVTIDFGSNGFISLSKHSLLKLQQEKQDLSTNYGYGSSSQGLYGAAAHDTVHYAVVSDLSFGEIRLHDQVVTFRENKATTLGMKFFKNYNILLNWKKKEMLLSKHKAFDHSSIREFGFKPEYDGKNIFISYIYNGSAVQQAGIQLGDMIVGINGADYDSLGTDIWCELAENGIARNLDSINMTIQRGDERISYDLLKTTILE